MSGIYIKEIEMPAPDEYVEVVIFGNGTVLQTGESWKDPENGKSYYTTLKEEKFFKAVFVPPHGRLIDEDVLIKTAHNQWPLPIDFLKLLELVPTVIPADGKDIKVPTREEEV